MARDKYEEAYHLLIDMRAERDALTAALRWALGACADDLGWDVSHDGGTEAYRNACELAGLDPDEAEEPCES